MITIIIIIFCVFSKFFGPFKPQMFAVVRRLKLSIKLNFIHAEKIQR